jgi:hypothetical protein
MMAPAALVEQPPGQGRGGQPLRVAALLRMQQTQGNRAVQRFLQHAAPAAAATPAVNQVGRTAGPVIQRYQTYTRKMQKPDIWNVGNAAVRVSDDGRMAVAKEDKYGSQRLWAEPTLIKDASQQLELAESVIRLKKWSGRSTLSGPAPDGSGAKTLAPVIPKNLATGTKGSKMTIWADCGKSACDVGGKGRGMGQGDRAAVYMDPAGKQASTTAHGPTRMKWQIMLEHFDTKIDSAKLNALLKKLNKAESDYGSETDAAKLKALENEIGLLELKIEDVIFAPYNALSDKKKEAFDKRAGINRYAAPSVGQAYTISTGGSAKPGYEDSTWNFHWAGVIMTSGGDTVTLENYATGVPD